MARTNPCRAELGIIRKLDVSNTGSGRVFRAQLEYETNLQYEVAIATMKKDNVYLAKENERDSSEVTADGKALSVKTFEFKVRSDTQIDELNFQFFITDNGNCFGVFLAHVKLGPVSDSKVEVTDFQLPTIDMITPLVQNVKPGSKFSLITEMSLKAPEKIDGLSTYGRWAKNLPRRDRNKNVVKNEVRKNWLSSEKMHVVRPEMVVSKATPSDEGTYCSGFGYDNYKNSFTHCVVVRLVGSGTFGKVGEVQVYSSSTMLRVLVQSGATSNTLKFFGNVPVSRAGDMIFVVVEGWPRPHVQVLKTDKYGVTKKLSNDVYCGYDLTTARVCFWSDDHAANSYTVEAGYREPLVRKSFETRVYTPIKFADGKENKKVSFDDRDTNNRITFECEVTSEPKATIKFFETSFGIVDSNWQPEYAGPALTETRDTRVETSSRGNTSKAKLTVNNMLPGEYESERTYICGADNGYDNIFKTLVVKWPATGHSFNATMFHHLEID
ncbi:uncharacterized protein LOC141903895 isoform X2 [Tubulanus polymorphus]